MKFTLSWLKEHLATSATVAEIADALTDLGLEVEAIKDPAAALAAFRIARVVEAKQHPNADRLRLCLVETWPEGPGGQTEAVQVVCGAPNARTGMVGVFASAGTYIPGTGVALKAGVIRGEPSNGMLCSEREMMLSDDHEGVIELPEDAPLGARFVDWLAAHDPAKTDPVIEIAITPNRPDALGIAGVARDLAARGLGRFVQRPVEPVPGAFPCPIGVGIDADTADGCPLFAGRLIRGVRNGPSPDWLRTQLRAIGLRPISALVDITNFWTIDRNRPLHVFDADLLQGDLRVHRARGGEVIEALDDKTYTLAPGMMAISDAAGPQSIAGCVGGAPTGVSAATVNVILESAYWDPVTIAGTARRLKVSSDAKYRFERGVDPEFTLPGLELATAMILEHCGGEPSDVVVAGAVPETARSYRLDPGRVQRLVGMDVPEAEQRRTLAALGFRIAGDRVHVPAWRPDIRGEADLVEEVARIASLSGLQGRPMARAAPGVPKPVLTPMQRRAAAVRRAIAAQGLNECVTYSFIDAASARRFGGGDDATRIENPISSEMSHLRPALLPGLLQAAARNQARGFVAFGLFEVGVAFHGGVPGDERLLASGIRVGQAGPRDVHGDHRPVDLYDAKADLEAALTAAGAPAKVQILRGAPDWWHPGRHGIICLGPKRPLGVFGELHPRVLAGCGVKGPAVGFTAFLEVVPFARSASTTRPALALAELQAVERDFAFVVDADVEALTLVNAARGADRALIASVRVFDEFAGAGAEAQMGAGRKSLAISVRLQPKERTLTDAEIEAVSAKIVAVVGKATGGTLRG